MAQRIAAVRLDPTAERPFRADQNVAAADALETLGIRLFPSLSPRCFSLLSRSGDNHERGKAERAAMASLGAVAGPLAGARAPQRVSTPPSSGLAMALPWPSPTSPRPGSASSPTPAKNRSGSSSSAPVKVHPTHPNPTPSFPFLSLSCSFRVYPNGEKLGLGLGFVLADSFSLPFISFFSFIRMEKIGIRVRVRPFFFLLPLFPSFGLEF